MSYLRTIALVTAVFTTVTAAAPVAAETTVQMLMRQKLDCIHAVLDAMMMDDYPRIAVAAEQLRQISRATTWYRNDATEFQGLATSFQDSADYLLEKASAKSADGVATGYIRVSMDCVQCHRVVRKEVRARLP